MNNLPDIPILGSENVKIVVYITLVIITIYFGCFLFRFTKNNEEKILLPLFLYLFIFLLVNSALYITLLS